MVITQQSYQSMSVDKLTTYLHSNYELSDYITLNDSSRTIFWPLFEPFPYLLGAHMNTFVSLLDTPYYLGSNGTRPQFHTTMLIIIQ